MAGAEAEEPAASLLGCFERRDRQGFLGEVQALLREKGKFAQAQKSLKEAETAAGPGFATFALSVLGDLAAGSQDPQAAAVLADVGRGADGQLGSDGESVVESLAATPGFLKTTVKVLAAWGVDLDALGARARAALEAAVRRDLASSAGAASAAAALAAMPSLLDAEAMRRAIESVDDGSRDDAGQSLAAALPRDLQQFFVQRRIDEGRLKGALKAVKALKLQEDFPELEFEYKQRALEGAITHASREACMGLALTEPRLHARCVHGLLAMGEPAAGLELAGAWNVELTDEERGRAEVAREEQSQKYLQLPEAFRISVVDSDATVEAMQLALLSEPVVGFDVEMVDGVAVLLQLAAAETAFLVDLLALGSSQLLATALTAVLQAPGVAKVGHSGSSDLTAVSKACPLLAGACRSAAPVFNLQKMEVSSSKRQGFSLSTFAEKYCGRPLDKALQTCDWRRRPLSAAQAQYAAMDAWVPVVVYARLTAGAAL